MFFWYKIGSRAKGLLGHEWFPVFAEAQTPAEAEAIIALEANSLQNGDFVPPFNKLHGEFADFAAAQQNATEIIAKKKADGIKHSRETRRQSAT